MLDLISILIALAAAGFLTASFFRRESKRGKPGDPAEDARALKRLDDLQREAKDGDRR